MVFIFSLSNTISIALLDIAELFEELSLTFSSVNKVNRQLVVCFSTKLPILSNWPKFSWNQCWVRSKCVVVDFLQPIEACEIQST